MEDTGKSDEGRVTRSIDFFRGFLRSPEQVGSIIPSSRFLERRMINLAGLEEAATAVELGPGTGGTTRAMLNVMAPDARLLTIELDPKFSGILESFGDHRLIPHTGSAADLQAVLDHYRLPAPDVIVSGIPFSTMPREVGTAILEAVRDSLGPGGRFIAYQFRGHVGRLGLPILGEPDVEFELFNVPPMRFYCWRKPVSGDWRGQRENGAGN